MAMGNTACPKYCGARGRETEATCGGCFYDEAKPVYFNFETKGGQHEGRYQIGDVVFDINGLGHHVLSILSREPKK